MGSAVALAVAGTAAVVVPIHLGLTSAVPYGPRWWLIAALLVLHQLVAGIAWLTGSSWWRTIPAGSLVVAWPVATALPIT